LSFECTNNTAEYEAHIIVLQVALALKIEKLNVYRDSLLIICQVKGERQAKDEKLRLYQDYLLKLANEFEEIKFTHISRDKNNFTDVLATLALMTHINFGSEFQPISIKIRNLQPHCSHQMENHGTMISRGLANAGNILYEPPRQMKRLWGGWQWIITWMNKSCIKGYSLELYSDVWERKKLSKHYRLSMRESMSLMLMDIWWQDKCRGLGTSGWTWKGIVSTMSENSLSVRYMVTR